MGGIRLFDLGAVVVGTGFIGAVHLSALRKLGVRIAGVLGSSPDRGAERARALGLQKAYATLAEVLADPMVQVVHVTSPNQAHFPQVMQILAAGKHVICEKPLAMTAAQSAQMVQAARDSGTVAAVCYNTRFFPLNQHAQAMVAAGELGDIRLITGHFFQDWLAKDTDWNWRLDPAEGGPLRSVSDIGTHWIDLTSFITGQKPVAVMADLSTFIKDRIKPSGPVETFSKTPTKGIATPIHTDDAALLMLRYANGARGSLTTSQVNHGRKVAMAWDIAGSAASAAWTMESHEQLWIGHRDAPNQILLRDPGLMNTAGATAAAMPGGHPEGYGDTFVAFFRQVYSDAAKGSRQPASTYASFADGHYEMRFCDVVLESAAKGAWVDV